MHAVAAFQSNIITSGTHHQQQQQQQRRRTPPLSAGTTTANPCPIYLSFRTFREHDSGVVCMHIAHPPQGKTLETIINLTYTRIIESTLSFSGSLTCRVVRYLE